MTRIKMKMALGQWAVRIFLLLVTVVTLYPLLWNVYSSFKTNEEFLGDAFALPSALQWDNYLRALEKTNIASNFKNSIYVVVVTLLVLVLCVVPCTYCLARHRFWGRGLMRNLYMSMIFVPASCIMIPLFLQMNDLGLLNKLTPLAVLYAVQQAPFSIFLLSGFMAGIPHDYEEAAMIDGCGYWTILLRIIVPMAKPGIATVVMLAAMNTWNEYAVALVMVTDPEKQTLPVGVANLYETQRYATDWGALFAALVMVLIPTAIVYIIGQKRLIQGVNVGGIKE